MNKINRAGLSRGYLKEKSCSFIIGLFEWIIDVINIPVVGVAKIILVGSELVCLWGIEQ